MAKHTTTDLPEARVVYHHLATPKAWSEADEPKYQVSLAWPAKEFDAPSDEWAKVKGAIHSVAEAAWGDRANQKRDGAPPYTVVFRHGADAEKNPEQWKDYVLATLRSKFEIPVLVVRDGELTEMDPSEVRKGMKAVVAVNPKAWKSNGRGVALYPHSILITDTEPDLAFNEATSSGDDGGGDPEQARERARKNAFAHFAAKAGTDKPRQAAAPTEEAKPADKPKDRSFPF